MCVRSIRHSRALEAYQRKIRRRNGYTSPSYYSGLSGEGARGGYSPEGEIALFSKFRVLPTEPRLKLCQATFPGPRAVEVSV
jgi:hypothetical protein